MEFGHYTYEMVVDWIELEVHVAERCKFWTMQEVLRDIQQLSQDVNPYVKLQGDHDNGASDTFRFKIQDPKSCAEIYSIIDGLGKRFNFVNPIKVTGIEVAFDTYLRGATVQQLAQIAFDRYRFSTHTPTNDWYFYRIKGEGREFLNALGHQREVHSLFEKGWQLTDTNSQDVPLRAHGYVKTTDRGGKDRLRVGQHAARYEFTLRDAALPCKSMQDLEGFDFSSLARLFKFRKLRDNLHPATRYSLTIWGGAGSQVGRRGDYRRKHPSNAGQYSGEKTKYRGSTVADAPLNKVARDQLRALTTAWRKTPYADFDGEKVIQNH